DRVARRCHGPAVQADDVHPGHGSNGWRRLLAYPGKGQASRLDPDAVHEDARCSQDITPVLGKLPARHPGGAVVRSGIRESIDPVERAGLRTEVEAQVLDTPQSQLEIQRRCEGQVGEERTELTDRLRRTGGKQLAGAVHADEVRGREVAT